MFPQKRNNKTKKLSWFEVQMQPKPFIYFGWIEIEKRPMSVFIVICVNIGEIAPFLDTGDRETDKNINF